MALFQGDPRQNFPSKGFDKFLSDEAEALRAPGAPARRVFKDAGDNNLLLVIGRRGAAFYYKGRTRTDDEGRRQDLTIKIGAPATTTIAQARAAAEKIRKGIAEGAPPVTHRATRRAARNAADERDAERAREEAAIEAARAKQAATIDALTTPGGRPPGREAFKALASAPLSRCAAAFALHGRDLRKAVTDKTWAATIAQLRLGLAALGAEDKTPDALDAPAIEIAFASLTNAAAQKRVTALKLLYSWLVRYGAAATNPAAQCPKIPAPDARREFADAGELQKIWRACDELPAERRDFLRLLVLLPLRRGELERAKVGDISTSLGIRQIRIPKENSKTKTEHRLPIVGEAAAIIDRLVAERDDGELLIPLTTTGKWFDDWTGWQDKMKRMTGIDWFYFHSMRKMFSTECSEHDLDEYSLIDACLNHAASATKTGSGGSYNFAKAMPRRQELLAAWDGVVRHAIATGKWPRHDERPAPAAGSNVTPMRRSK